MFRSFPLILILFLCTIGIFPVLADTDHPILLFYASGGYLEEKGNLISGNLQAILDGSDDELPLLIAYGGTGTWKGIRYVNRSMLLDDSRNGIFGDDTKTLYLNEASNMGEPKTLSSFLRYAKTLHPDSRLWLILIGHGDAYEGVLLDENHGNDMLSTSELGAALAESGTNIEFIGIDACLMATLEMAAEVDGYASWMIASQETEPGMGWDYHTWLRALTALDEIQLPDAAFPLLKAHMDQNEPGKTLSLLYLDETASTVQSLGELARALTILLQTTTGAQYIEAALLDTQHFGLTDTMELVPVTLDILSFTEAISKNIPYLSGIAKATAEATDRMIVRSRHDATVPAAHGISLVSPLLMTPDIYSIYAKQNAVHRDWNVFLKQYAEKHPALALSEM